MESNIKRTLDLKIFPEYFEQVTCKDPLKRKRLEIRKEDDKSFEVGDILNLKEWDEENKVFSGRRVKVQVTNILRGSPYLPYNYCALSIILLEDLIKIKK
jgi:hypothetical protein